MISRMAPRGTMPCLRQSLQGLGRHPFGEGNFAFHLGVGAFELLVEVLGNVHGLAALHLDPDACSHIAQLVLILDLVIA